MLKVRKKLHFYYKFKPQHFGPPQFQKIYLNALRNIFNLHYYMILKPGKQILGLYY